MTTSKRRDSQRRKWLATIRGMGRTAFVWRRGVLGFGLPFVAMVTLSDCAFRPSMFTGVDSPVERSVLFAAFNLPFGLLAGWIWGRVMWRWFEKRNGNP